MSPSTTLRAVNDLPTAPAVLADSTVILVDYQVTYTTGVMELEGWEPALDAAADLLARARAAGSTVVHVVHDGGSGTPYDISAPIGQVHERVAPIDGEAVVVKNAPNAFVGTDLGDLVDAAGHADVVVAGFMTHMCVTFTAEGAFLRGSRPTVVADASATRPLPGVDGPVAARDLHRAALATISDLYAVVVPTAAELG
ncbi:isochorismatase family protein [Frigoribacterium sp. VKM Ac-2530]|uniref:isochorismatase family protein n=1 Tax=Frigoribacterium sp. VKM Ac-2530 TaxID=2783822 RepID=UPI00188B508C|nr:isochorismatase family protein [Frigoribacterium sp. VKM Ac-2530]MBF4579411.1 isochorismatase family protein [Frigoribacterium sp. VKM Ac-2530]